MNYGKLNPGVYLQLGDEIKSINLETATLHDLFGDDASISDFSRLVAWVHIALNARENRMHQIPTQWEVGGNISDKPKFELDFSFPQIDRALQLYSVAYLRKVRNANGGLQKISWLDPRTITPHYTRSGVDRYKRKGFDEPLPVDDVIRIYLRGISEQAPRTSGSAITKIAAEIMYYSERALSGVYKANAVPPLLVYVPPLTGDSEKETLRAFFSRLFNGKGATSDGYYRVVPVSKEVSIEKLSFAPNELATKDTREFARDEILGVHGVPLSEVLGNAANYATATNETRQFIVSIGGRLSMIAGAINNDKDVLKAKTKLVVKTEMHPEMQRNDESVSRSLVLYSRVFTPQAAAYLVGITDNTFPEDVGNPFLDEVKLIGATTPSDNASNLSKYTNADLDKWRNKAVRVGGYVDFNSDYIDDGLHLSVSAGLKMAKTKDEILTVFSRAKRRVVENADINTVIKSAMNELGEL